MEYYKILKYLEDQLKGTDLELFKVNSVDTNTIHDDSKTYGFVNCEIKFDLGDKSQKSITVGEKCDVGETNSDMPKHPEWLVGINNDFITTFHDSLWANELTKKINAMSGVHWRTVKRDFMYYCLYSTLQYLYRTEKRDLYDIVFDVCGDYALGFGDKLDKHHARATELLRKLRSLRESGSFCSLRDGSLREAVIRAIKCLTSDDVYGIFHAASEIPKIVLGKCTRDTISHLYHKLFEIANKHYY